MNSKQLLYFIKAAEKQSIAAAAKTLDIAAPAISHQLASLEHELKTKLFHRDHRGVILTESGHRFFLHAQQLLQTMEMAKQDVSQLSDSASIFTIGMNEAIGNILSGRLLDAFSEVFPKTNIDIRIGTTVRLSKWLEQQKIDMALTYSPLDLTANYLQMPLITESLFLIVGKEHPSFQQAQLIDGASIAFWQLSNFDLIALNSRDSAYKLLNETAIKAGIKLNFSVPYSGQLSTNLRSVAQGKGMIVLPSSAVYELQAREVVHVINIIEPELTRDVVACYSSLQANEKHNKEALNIIKLLIKQSHLTKEWRGQLLFS